MVLCRDPGNQDKKVIFSFNSQTQALLDERGNVKVTDVCYIMDPSAHDEA